MTFYHNLSVEHYLYGSLSLGELLASHPQATQFYTIAESCLASTIADTICNLKKAKRAVQPANMTDYLYMKAVCTYFLYSKFVNSEDEIRKYVNRLSKREKAYGSQIIIDLSNLLHKLPDIRPTLKIISVLGLFDPLNEDPAFPFFIFAKLISTKNSVNDTLMRKFGYDPNTPEGHREDDHRLYINQFSKNMLCRMIHAIQNNIFLNTDRTEKMNKHKTLRRTENIKAVLHVLFRLGYTPYDNELFCRCEYHHTHSYPENYTNSRSTIQLSSTIHRAYSRHMFCNVFCVLWRLIACIHRDYLARRTLFETIYDNGIAGEINYTS